MPHYEDMYRQSVIDDRLTDWPTDRPGILENIHNRHRTPWPRQSGVSGPTFRQCCQATSAAPLVACSSTHQLQAFSHHIQDEIDWQPGLPTSSHPRLSTSTHIATIGQIVTYCTSDGASIVSESVQH